MCKAVGRLRFSVAFWHTLRGDGSDPFGSPTKVAPVASRYACVGCLPHLARPMQATGWC